MKVRKMKIMIPRTNIKGSLWSCVIFHVSEFYALIYNAQYYRVMVPTAAITWNFLTFMQSKFQTHYCGFIGC